MYLSPPSSCYQLTWRNLVFSNSPNHVIQPDCIHQTNGFFQCFPAAPKPHFTLRMGVVRVWAINLSRIWTWRGRSWRKPQWIVQRIVGITISNSQRLWLGFSLWKHSSQYVGKYSVGKDMVYQIWQNSKIECFASILQEGITCEILVKTSYHHLSWLFAF